MVVIHSRSKQLYFTYNYTLLHDAISRVLGHLLGYMLVHAFLFDTQKVSKKCRVYTAFIIS